MDLGPLWERLFPLHVAACKADTDQGLRAIRASKARSKKIARAGAWRGFLVAHVKARARVSPRIKP